MGLYPLRSDPASQILAVGLLFAAPTSYDKAVLSKRRLGDLARKFKARQRHLVPYHTPLSLPVALYSRAAAAPRHGSRLSRQKAARFPRQAVFDICML